MFKFIKKNDKDMNRVVYDRKRIEKINSSYDELTSKFLVFGQEQVKRTITVKA